MRINEVRRIPSLDSLMVLSPDHPVAVALLTPVHCHHVAEATDLRRLKQLLARQEYAPCMAIQSDLEDEENPTVSVFFTRFLDPAYVIPASQRGGGQQKNHSSFRKFDLHGQAGRSGTAE